MAIGVHSWGITKSKVVRRLYYIGVTADRLGGFFDKVTVKLLAAEIFAGKNVIKGLQEVIEVRLCPEIAHGGIVACVVLIVGLGNFHFFRIESLKVKN
jgi:hypothetical protein